MRHKLFLGGCCLPCVRPCSRAGESTPEKPLRSWLLLCCSSCCCCSLCCSGCCCCCCCSLCCSGGGNCCECCCCSLCCSGGGNCCECCCSLAPPPPMACSVSPHVLVCADDKSLVPKCASRQSATALVAVVVVTELRCPGESMPDVGVRDGREVGGCCCLSWHEGWGCVPGVGREGRKGAFVSACVPRVPEHDGAQCVCYQSCVRAKPKCSMTQQDGLCTRDCYL